MLHQHVPLNEYTAMFLAALIDSDIPEISLSELSLIDNLPPTPLPDEAYAYGIKRFDRGTNGQRIHTEHFAQVFFEYAQNKYERHNYEEIARKLKAETLHRPDNIRQITLRLLANVLMGNGDAHLKNWSLIYRDTQQADLSPAYDIVFTRAYMGDERELALNMGSIRRWYEMSLETFRAWADASGLNRRLIGHHRTGPRFLARGPDSEPHVSGTPGLTERPLAAVASRLSYQVRLTLMVRPTGRVAMCRAIGLAVGPDRLSIYD